MRHLAIDCEYGVPITLYPITNPSVVSHPQSTSHPHHARLPCQSQSAQLLNIGSVCSARRGHLHAWLAAASDVINTARKSTAVTPSPPSCPVRSVWCVYVVKRHGVARKGGLDCRGCSEWWVPTSGTSQAAHWATHGPTTHRFSATHRHTHSPVMVCTVGLCCAMDGQKSSLYKTPLKI